VIAGMSQCFSSGYVCRQCDIQHADLQSIRWGTGPGTILFIQ
jgi:hypothetical protein